MARALWCPPGRMIDIWRPGSAMAMPWRCRGRRRNFLTRITLQTPIFHLHRRIYRSPASGTYQGDPRRRRSAAAGSSQRCRERRARTFSTKLGNVITNGHVYATPHHHHHHHHHHHPPSIICESALRRPRTLNPPLWHRVALQLRKDLRCGSTDAKLFAVTLHPMTLIATCCARWNRTSQAWQYPLQSLGTAFTGRRRTNGVHNGRSAATQRVSPWTRADQHLFCLA